MLLRVVRSWCFAARAGTRRVALAFLVPVLASVAAAPQTLSPAERQSNIESFEKVWRTVLEKHWDPKLGGIDWQSVHDEFRPKMESAETAAQGREVMNAMLGRLHLTHYGVFGRDVYRELDAGSGEATPGFEVRVMGGEALVVDVDRYSPAAARGVKPGWEIVRIGDLEIAPVLRRIEQGFRRSTLLDVRL